MGKVYTVKRFGVLTGFIFLFFILVSVNCNFIGVISRQIELDQTSTVRARQTEWIGTATEEARLYNNKTATAEQKAVEAYDATQTAVMAAAETQDESSQQTEAAPKPPIITAIDFPNEIPGNKSTMIGLLYFQDPDGDIKQVNYRVVRAKQFGGGVDDQPKLDHGSWTNGAIKIYLWCEGQQVVTLEATILDYAGNYSNIMSFTFTCK